MSVKDLYLNAVPNLSHHINQFHIGDRILLKNLRFKGTVAYIGPTHFSAEDLVG